MAEPMTYHRKPITDRALVSILRLDEFQACVTSVYFEIIPWNYCFLYIKILRLILTTFVYV